MNGERKQKDNRLFGGAAKFGSKMYLLALFGLLVLSLLWLAPQKAFTLAAAGNGPGGVGVTDGSSTLELWLRADWGVFSDGTCSILANDGDGVGCWQDQSGNTAHAKQQAVVDVPTYDDNTNPINGQPVLNFAVNAGVGQVLVSDPTKPINLGAFTVFAVFNATNGGIVYEHNDRNGTLVPGSNLFTSDDCSTTVNRGGNETTKSLASTWATDGLSRVVTQGYNGDHASHTISVNNTASTFLVAPCNDDPITPLPGTSVLSAPVFIGDRSGGNVVPLRGNIAELIFFNENLPDVQKILVENYLSSKYNIAFDAPIPNNDYYDGDTVGNGDFDLDVAGIGQLGGLQNDVAHSVGMTVQDNTFLNDNGDWLLFGHNAPANGNTTTYLPTETPWDSTDSAPKPARWNRSWYIDVTDAITTTGGTVNITFDFIEGGMGSFAPTNTTLTNYRLLKRDIIGNNYTDLGGATSVDVINKRVTFTGVSVTDLGSDFTLGTLDNDISPTAVSLQPIVATPQTNGLLIFAACVLALGFGSLWACLRHRPE